MRRSLALLFTVLCFFGTQANSCGGGGGSTHTYAMHWTYDCSAFKAPASFNYGYVNGTSYVSLGNLTVAPGCKTLSSYSVTGKSGVVSVTTTFYVRSYYTNPVQYSDAALARVGGMGKKGALEVDVTQVD